VGDAILAFATGTLRKIHQLIDMLYNERILDVQAKIDPALKRRARFFKAGLSHGVVLGVEIKHDDVSLNGILKEGDCQRDDQYNDGLVA
jgi:hypothetical protein